MYNLLIMQRQKKKYQNEKLNGIKLARNYSEHFIIFFHFEINNSSENPPLFYILFYVNTSERA